MQHNKKKKKTNKVVRFSLIKHHKFINQNTHRFIQLRIWKCNKTRAILMLIWAILRMLCRKSNLNAHHFLVVSLSYFSFWVMKWISWARPWKKKNFAWKKIVNSLIQQPCTIKNIAEIPLAFAEIEYYETIIEFWFSLKQMVHNMICKNDLW